MPETVRQLYGAAKADLERIEASESGPGGSPLPASRLRSTSPPVVVARSIPPGVAGHQRESACGTLHCSVKSGEKYACGFAFRVSEKMKRVCFDYGLPRCLGPVEMSIFRYHAVVLK